MNVLKRNSQVATYTMMLSKPGSNDWSRVIVLSLIIADFELLGVNRDILLHAFATCGISWLAAISRKPSDDRIDAIRCPGNGQNNR